MTRTVKCLKLGRDAEGLDHPPFPGDFGKKIFENISKEAWQDWMNLQTRLINEYRLNLLEPEAKEYVMNDMNKHLFSEEEKAQKAKTWNYDKNGPSKWGEFCDICNTGEKQSPVNIENAKPHGHSLEFHYQDAALHVKLNYHSVYVHEDKNSPQTIKFNGMEYKQVQLHFHAPSEHHLEDKPFPMELHFVHKNENDEILVVGVFIKEGGADNKYLSELYANLPKNRGDEIVDFEAKANPIDLLPQNRSFYNYAGSLTTPPCSEGVTWVVMHSPLVISAAQIKTFREAIVDGNIRPIQPLNDRPITFTK